MKILLAAATVAVLAACLLPVQSAYAQFQQGGVDHPGEWYVGEGLEHGDFFSYSMCHASYKECRNFQMDIWVEGDQQDGTETKWLTQVVVYDGATIAKGEMLLSKVATEPTGGSEEIDDYRTPFKSSIVWLSAFANAHDTKAFRDVSWGKIGNIGGEQILPKEILEDGLTVGAGHFEDVILIGWRTGGYPSAVYVVDDFPFPIRANTLQHVSEGIPPPEYDFELIRYEKNVTEDPFADVVSTAQQQSTRNCPPTDNLENSVKRSTQDGKYLLHVFYAPDTPVNGCDMRWQIKFLNKFDETEFLAQVQYDIAVINENREPGRNLAQEEDRRFLYSPSGLATLDIPVKEDPGLVTYAIYVFGLAPEHIAPGIASLDWLYIDLPVESSTIPIPPWIKSTAGFWTAGATSDTEFFGAIQYLIGEGIIIVPPTDVDPEPSGIPSWIKTTVQFWIDGHTSDAEFVSSIQYLITIGIITV